MIFETRELMVKVWIIFVTNKKHITRMKWHTSL